MLQVQQNTLKALFFAFATIVVGSGAGAASKWISDTVPVAVIVMIQYGVCVLIIMPWLIRQRFKPVTFNRQQNIPWKKHLIRGVSGWLSFFCYYAALKNIPLVDASLLRNAAPLFVPLVAWLWVRAKVPSHRWFPLIIGFIGVTLVLRPDSSNVSYGHIIGLLSGIGLAISMIGTRLLSKTQSANTIISYYFFISLLCSLPFGIYYWQAIPLWSLPYLLFIGVSIYATMVFYTKAYSYAKPSVVAPISYFSVIISGAMGWLIWQHIPSSTALIGATLVIVAGFLTIYLSDK